MMPPGMPPSAEHGDAGVDVVLAGLQQASFPMDKAHVCDMVGDLEVADASGARIAVRRLLDRVDQSRFESGEDVAHALRTAVALEADRPAAD